MKSNENVPLQLSMEDLSGESAKENEELKNADQQNVEEIVRTRPFNYS